MIKVHFGSWRAMAHECEVKAMLQHDGGVVLSFQSKRDKKKQIVIELRDDEALGQVIEPILGKLSMGAVERHAEKLNGLLSFVKMTAVMLGYEKKGGGA